MELLIFPIDSIDECILKYIGSSLERSFGFPFKVLDCEENLLHTEGLLCNGKYNSTAILLYLLNNIPKKYLKILAVTQLDLYSPIFSHLYGEAQLSGSAALMSIHRLNPEFYHLPANLEVFLSRCEKEAIHEIGHTFGLVHCKDNNCVMYPSSNIDDTDVKSSSFCQVCSRLKKVF